MSQKRSPTHHAARGPGVTTTPAGLAVWQLTHGPRLRESSRVTSNDEQVTSNEDRRLAAKRKLEARLAAERAARSAAATSLIGVLSVITLLVAATIVWVAQNFIGTVTCDWGKPQNTLADTVKDRATDRRRPTPERRAEAEKYMNTLAAGVPKERTSPQPSSNVPVPFPGTKRCHQDRFMVRQLHHPDDAGHQPRLPADHAGSRVRAVQLRGYPVPGIARLLRRHRLPPPDP